MKRQTMMQVSEAGEPDEGGPTEMSAEAALHREIAELGEWLTAQGFDPRDNYAHPDEGSRDRLYWYYGYLIGLKQALALLTTHGATVH